QQTASVNCQKGCHQPPEGRRVLLNQRDSSFACPAEFLLPHVDWNIGHVTESNPTSAPSKNIPSDMKAHESPTLPATSLFVSKGVASKDCSNSKESEIARLDSMNSACITKPCET